MRGLKLSRPEQSGFTSLANTLSDPAFLVVLAHGHFMATHSFHGVEYLVAKMLQDSGVEESQEDSKGMLLHLSEYKNLGEVVDKSFNDLSIHQEKLGKDCYDE